MRITTKRSLLILLFILSAISLVRLLRITVTISSPSSTCITTKHQLQKSPLEKLAKKELNLLLKTISYKSPCNLLVFGHGPQSQLISTANNGGITIYLEDEPQNINIGKNYTHMQVYKVNYSTAARDAFKLLKHTRENSSCAPSGGLPQSSNCLLAIKELPKEVYDHEWDIILVDGPRGDTAESPGRMAAIYTAGLLARIGKSTEVLVHDVDRMVEKWFSWEFLCEENMVSSKGKLWHFRIRRNFRSKSFCSNVIVQIL